MFIFSICFRRPCSIPASRTSTAFVLAGGFGVLSFLPNPKKLLFLGLLSRIDRTATSSSSGSSDIASSFKRSVLLLIVVEQFICPPMKKATLPLESNNGAEQELSQYFPKYKREKPTHKKQVPERFRGLLIIEQELDSLLSSLN